MDGPFPSVYPWNEELGLCSLTSALYTPLSKVCKNYKEAEAVFQRTSLDGLFDRARSMIRQIEYYCPIMKKYTEAISSMKLKTAIRAMPYSAEDARLCKVIKTAPGNLAVVSGKIDAIFHAEDQIKRMIAI